MAIMFFRCSLFSFNPLFFSAAPLAGLALKKESICAVGANAEFPLRRSGNF